MEIWVSVKRGFVKILSQWIKIHGDLPAGVAIWSRTDLNERRFPPPPAHPHRHRARRVPGSDRRHPPGARSTGLHSARLRRVADLAGQRPAQSRRGMSDRDRRALFLPAGAGRFFPAAVSGARRRVSHARRPAGLLADRDGFCHGPAADGGGLYPPRAGWDTHARGRGAGGPGGGVHAIWFRAGGRWFAGERPAH